MYKGARYTEGYRTIMDIVRMQDFDDPYGAATANLFGLATVAYVEFGEVLPEFRPSPMIEKGEDLDDWPDGEFQYYVREGDVTLSDIRAAYRVLSRYYDLIPESARY